MPSLRLLIASWLARAGTRLATVTPPPPARVPQIGETLWLDGEAHTLVEFLVDKGLARAWSLDGKRRHTFQTAELVFLELYGWWTMKGREGQLPNPNAAKGA